MLSHITTDLHQVYLEEVFTPQLGKPGASTPAKPKSSSDIDGDGDVDSFEKKVRQLIYDVRHIMKAKKVPAEKAFQMRSSKTNYSAEVVKAAKEKLGIRGGSATPVSEEILSEDDKVGILVNYKNGTTYRKSVSRDSVQTELQKFRSNPNVSSVEQTKYGLAKKDYDGDGNIESGSKEHAGAVHNAIQRNKGGVPDGQDTRGKTSKKKVKGYGLGEGFSNWRQDLKEVAGIDDEIASRNKKQIKEKNVNNYAGGKDSAVKINPEVTEKTKILGGHIVESFELNEEYLNEAVDIATEFFYNCGLNENGVDIVIEELGEETFSEFVFELSEEYFLSEELKKSESKVKTSKAPKGTKQYATTIARVKKQGGTKMTTKDRVGSTIRKDKIKKAVEKAKETQAPSSEKSTEGTKKEVRKGILGHLKQSWQTAREVGREHEKRVTNAAATVAGAVAGARKFGKKVEQSPEATRARRKATVAVGRKAQEAGKVAVKAAGAAGAAVGSGVAARRRGASAAGVAGAALGAGLRKLTKEELELQEKAESEQQQKLFGLALSVKRGDTPRSDASAEVLKIVDTMSEKKIRDFAKTPHSEVPKKKVTEAISNPEGVNDRESPRVTQRQKDTVDKYIKNKQKQYGSIGEDMTPTTPEQITAHKRLSQANMKAVQKLKPEPKTPQQQKPQTQNASYEPKGEQIDELNSVEKRTSINTKTGRPTQTGGNPEIAARNKAIAPAKIGGSKQPKKVPGKKPLSPSEEARKMGVLSPLESRAKQIRNSREAKANFEMPAH